MSDSSKSDEQSKKYSESTGIQKISGIISICLIIMAMGFLIKWMGGYNRTQTYLGGYNMGELIFNWHPTLMVTGLIFCGTCSMLSYRILPFPKPLTKSIHALLHTAAMIFIIIGLACVITGNNYEDHNEADDEYYSTGYYANFVSLHSFIGITTCIMYALNYFFGLFYFLMPGFSVEARQAYMPNHMFFGIFLLIAATCASITGIQELTSEYGCGYSVSEADWNPAKHYHRLTAGCKLANGAGYCIFLALLFSSYALFGPGAATATGIKEPFVSSKA